MKLIVFCFVLFLCNFLLEGAGCCMLLSFNLHHMDVLNLHIPHAVCEMFVSNAYCENGQNSVTHVNHTALIYSIAHGLCQGAGQRK